MASSSSSLVSATAPPSGTYFDHVVVILMENHALSEIYGPAPYMTSLANNYSLAQHYSATSHPSEGNYISLIGGSNFGHTSDGYCCYGITAPNLIDRLEGAGLTWEADAEAATNSSTCAFTPPRNADHFPFKTFSNMNTTSRCSHFLTTSAADQHEFIATLNKTSPPNYLWLTPTDSHNMHDNSVASGDAYLSVLVPRILNSLTFTTRRAALVITFDEGTGTTPNDLVYWVAAGPMANTAYKSTFGYTHYSFLRVLEDNWGLATLQSNDGSATAMTEFFKNGAAPTPLPSNFILLSGLFTCGIVRLSRRKTS